MINLVELLKDCPEGMELDCVMYDNVYFKCIREHPIYPIVCYTINSIGEKHELSFNWFGKHTPLETAKCAIFPKGKITWEGFEHLNMFKDGDILINKNGNIFIYKGLMHYCKNLADFYCGYRISDKAFVVKELKDSHFGEINGLRLASELEEQLFFQILLNNGYKWDAETKTLEKLNVPKFKIGDRIKSIYNCNQYDVIGLTDTHYTLEEVENKFKYIELIIDDKNWELVPDKFDTNTLVPFETRVLVRGECGNLWKPAIFGCYMEGANAPYYTLGGNCWKHCIPYEGNEHLLGKTDDIDEHKKI